MALSVKLTRYQDEEEGEKGEREEDNDDDNGNGNPLLFYSQDSLQK